MTKAIALLSGGLDSRLAVKLMLEQGIEVFALNFTSAFCTCSGGKNKEESGCKSEARKVSTELNIPLKLMVKGPEYMEIVRNPKFGYGAGINPCVDCRIYMFALAKRYMEEIGASFIVTGEVLGQRPMSQRRDAFKTTERESGLSGLILRPLCAKHLDPTIPEKTGLVNRELLLDMEGRSRKPQMKLAETLDMTDYPCPSGGCLLTDKTFAKKVRDLLAYKKDLTMKDLQVLKIGRHFRHDGVKLIVSKNEAENLKLKNFIQPGDTFLEPMNFTGPAALVCGAEKNNAAGMIGMAGSLILRYASAKAKDVENTEIKATSDDSTFTFVAPERINEAAAEKIRVC